MLYSAARHAVVCNKLKQAVLRTQELQFCPAFTPAGLCLLQQLQTLPAGTVTPLVHVKDMSSISSSCKRAAY